MKTKKIRKARISFNHEIKILEITEKLYQKSRLVDNLSEMVMEESPFFTLEDKYKYVPIFMLPDDIREKILEETELERVCEKHAMQFDSMIINLIKKNFDVDNPKNICIINSFNPTDEDSKIDIVLDIEATDLSLEEWHILKRL